MAIYYPPPQPTQRRPHVVQEGPPTPAHIPSGVRARLVPALAREPSYLVLPRRGFAAILASLEQPVPTLHLSWSVAGRPAEVRLRLSWSVTTADGAAPPQPRLRLSWTVGVPDPRLRLTWLVVSQGLANAHASPNRVPVAEVTLETTP